jgi:hypothetical protein
MQTSLTTLIVSPALRDAHAKCVNFTQSGSQFESNSPYSSRSLARHEKCKQISVRNSEGCMKKRNRLAMIVIVGAMTFAVPLSRGQNIGERMWTPPATGNFFPLSDTSMPPIPWCPDLPIYYLGILPGMNGPCYGYDDSSLGAQTSNVEPPPEPGEGEPGSDPGVPPINSPSYGTNDLWIDLTGITNDLVSLTLHNTHSNMYCQLLTNRDLRFPKEWGFGQIVRATNNTTLFAPEPKFWDKSFYRAVEGFPIVSISAGGDAIEPTNAFSGQSGAFFISLSSPVTNELAIVYKISGSAQNGVDYTAISNTIIAPVAQTFVPIEIDPIQDNLIEFEEYVTLTLILTNGYVVDPQQYKASIRISDNFGSNVFTTVTDLIGPAGIDYSPTANSLIVSVNHKTPNDGEPYNFARIYTNGVSTNLIVTNWSGIHGLMDEVKLATVKTTAAGFTVGDAYFGTGTNGVVATLSANGAVSNLAWAVLSLNQTNTDTLLRGGLYIDDSGSFGGDLITVTGAGEQEGGGVWRISSSGTPTLLTTISNTHLEGAITLTNDV